VTAGKIRAAETEQGFDFDERCVACRRPGGGDHKITLLTVSDTVSLYRPMKRPNRIAACDAFGDSDWLNAAIAVTKIAAGPDRAELKLAPGSTRAAIGRPNCESATERSRWAHRGTMARRG
jgi:hypothetical protein